MHQRLVTKNAIAGATNTSTRSTCVMVLIEEWNLIASRSLPPAIQNIAYIVISETMKAVRVGALRGRCRMWCSRLSPVIHASRNGSTVRNIHAPVGSRMTGTRMFQDRVWPHRWVSQPGMMRSAPSGQPMYQSGCEPAVTLVGSYGPNFHTGLIDSSAPMMAVTPKTTKKKPPALAAYTGSIG